MYLMKMTGEYLTVKEIERRLKDSKPIDDLELEVTQKVLDRYQTDQNQKKFT